MISTPKTHARRAWIVAPAFVAMSLAGCVTFSPDAGMDVVSGVTQAALGQEARRVDTEKAATVVRGRVRRLLASPLSAARAVEIALLNNSGLQAAYNEL